MISRHSRGKKGGMLNIIYIYTNYITLVIYYVIPNRDSRYLILFVLMELITNIIVLMLFSGKIDANFCKL